MTTSESWSTPLDRVPDTADADELLDATLKRELKTQVLAAGCTHYFCDVHLFLGGPVQMCEPCYDLWAAEQVGDD